MNFIKSQIIKTAKLCFEEGFVNGSAGNISYTYKNDMFITTTGSCFGDLKEQDIIKMPIDAKERRKASSEFFVHQSIVKHTHKKAILHTHPKYTVLASYVFDEIVPIDSEGKTYFEKIPILELKNPSASKELEEGLSNALIENDIVIIKTHGVFAACDNLIRAYTYTGALEHSCFILLKAKNMLK